MRPNQASPALLTRTSMRPNVSMTPRTTSSTSPATAASATIPTARTPWLCRASTASSSAALPRAQMTTSAPSAASSSAIARPMPLLAAVTSATLPLNPRSTSVLHCSSGRFRPTRKAQPWIAQEHVPGGFGGGHPLGHDPAEGAADAGGGMFGEDCVEDLPQVILRRVLEAVAELFLERCEDPGREPLHEERQTGRRSLPQRTHQQRPEVLQAPRVELVADEIPHHLGRHRRRQVAQD